MNVTHSRAEYNLAAFMCTAFIDLDFTAITIIHMADTSMSEPQLM